MRIKKLYTIKKHSFFLFRCDDCFSFFKARQDRRSDDFCLRCANVRSGKKRTTHGMTNKNSRIHVIWGNMKRRCLNPTEKEKRNYSLVGMCDEWLDFVPFMEWSNSNGYSDLLTLDRIDNDRGYYPDNCRFVDVSTQNANKRRSDKNKSGYIGVYTRNGVRFRSYIDWKRERIELGTFSCPIVAAKVRDKYVFDNGLPHTLNFIEGDR